MKVVMLGRYPADRTNGGVEAHVKGLVAAMGKASKAPAFEMISFGDADRTFFNGNARVTILKIHSIYYVLPILPIIALAMAVRKARPDIVHVQGASISPYLIYTLIAGSYKKAVTLHGIPTREYMAGARFRIRGLRYALRKFLEMRLRGGAGLLICVTKSLKDIVLEADGECEKKTVVIPNGINTDRNRRRTKAEARRFLGIGQDEFAIFHAKAFVVYNGQRYLVDAMPEIRARLPRAKLYLAGDGPLRQEITDRVASNKLEGEVTLLGNIPNDAVYDYLCAADVVCIPSISIEGVQENSSIFLLESMAMERPVVASNIGGLAEAIADGKNGLLVPDRDPGAIAAAVIRLGDAGYAKRIARCGREYVETQRTWDIIVEKTIAAYRGMCD